MTSTREIEALDACCVVPDDRVECAALDLEKMKGMFEKAFLQIDDPICESENETENAEYPNTLDASSSTLITSNVSTVHEAPVTTFVLFGDVPVPRRLSVAPFHMCTTFRIHRVYEQQWCGQIFRFLSGGYRAEGSVPFSCSGTTRKFARRRIRPKHRSTVKTIDGVERNEIVPLPVARETRSQKWAHAIIRRSVVRFFRPSEKSGVAGRRVVIAFLT